MANNRVSPFDIQDSSILDGEFNTFCTNLETIQRKFLEDWIKTWRESREETISNHYEKVMTECEGNMEKLEQNKKDQESRSVQLKDVTKQLEKLKEQKKVLEEKCTEDKLKDLLNKFESESKDLNALEKVTTAKRDKITNALGYFKQRLGLEFKNIKGEEQIQVIFTNIDECDPERQFVFNTKIVQSQYQINGCNPVIKDIDGYIDELNKTNNFSMFLIKMRKAFKKTLTNSKENNPPS